MNEDSSYKTQYLGFYFDGINPIKHEVNVTITRDGLKIQKLKVDTYFWWDLSEINQSNDIYADKEVKLEKGDDIPEILIIKDVSFIKSLKQISPDFQTKFQISASRSKWLKMIVYLSIASIIIITVFYKWLFPSFAELIAQNIPVSWEVKLGQNYKKYFVSQFKECEKKELKDKIELINDQLVETIPNTDYKYNITILDFDMVNAFALPGGEIIIFRGLIEKSKRPEELAGVMAHEIQHIEQRHMTKILIKDKSLDILISFMTGDSSGAGTALMAAKTLGSLAYRRSEESSADTEGLKMLVDARIDPNGLIDFFETLKKEYGNMPDIFKYISTHPDTGDRIEKLDNIIKGYSFKPEKLLPDVNWEETKMLCSKTKESNDVKIDEEEN
ncbi:MAG: M48 family metallopeptidase [Candidatus Dadabacteria bacterium]|nr:M48 family metallopeptidase [Candidatus Dadabacteria bacterium]